MPCPSVTVQQSAAMDDDAADNNHYNVTAANNVPRSMNEDIAAATDTIHAAAAENHGHPESLPSDGHEDTYASLSAEERIGMIREEFYDPEEDLDEDIDLTKNDNAEAADDMHVEGPNIFPLPPRTDAAGDTFIKIVARSGIHSLSIAPCFCHGAADTYLQYMDIELFPASYKRVSTAFTFDVMDDFRLQNLECKMTAYEYFQSIRRVTNPTFPYLVPNRYIELRRLSRAWRNLRLHQQHGFSFHEDHDSPGSMAFFCAACPQPGINLKADWKNDEDQDVYGRYDGTDGNFKSHHQLQKYPQRDVRLWDGQMFMANRRAVEMHEVEAQKIAKKVKKVCNELLDPRWSAAAVTWNSDH